jgi:tRNA G18 (ribose-2'-O)-methylase SpoU
MTSNNKKNMIKENSQMESLLPLFSNLKSANHQLKDRNLFIAEGRIIFDRLFHYPDLIRGVLCNRMLFSEMENLSDSRWPVYAMESSDISQITGYSFHQGVLTLGSRPVYPDETVTRILNQSPSTLLITPDITDEANLGSIIRSACAFGVQMILTGKGSADPYSRRTIRTSMGNIFNIPVIPMEDESSWAEKLKKSGYHISGAALHENAVRIKDYKRRESEAIIFGHESKGINEFWLNQCDHLIMIPMQNGTDSLNVMVSAGIFLYEFCGK